VYVECSLLKPLLLIAGCQDISDRTMMMPADIIETLKQLNLLQYWKGRWVICGVEGVTSTAYGEWSLHDYCHLIVQE